MRKFLIKVAAVAMMLVPMVGAAPVWAAGCTDDCIKTNLLFNTTDGDTHCYCAKDSSKGGAIIEILMIVLNIFSGLVLVLAVAGIVIAGVQYLTARDNEGQVAKAKMRLFQIVLGLVAYALMWAFLNWIVPGGIFSSSGGTESSMVEDAWRDIA